MNKKLADFIVNFDHIKTDDLVENWTWLIGNDKTPILISSIGDMFVKDKDDKIYWLEVGGGKFEVVANGLKEFEAKLGDIDQVNEWFMIDLSTSLRLSDKKLKPGQIYSFKKLPVLGGDYTVDNFEPIDIEVHFCFTGQIHEQIKDLPDGTKIDKIKFVD